MAEALGVPRKTLAALRTKHLRTPADFTLGENGAVLWTKQGLEKIEVLLMGNGKESSGKSALPQGPPLKEMMVIERVSENPGLLLCHSEERKLHCAVRVRDNGNFAPGMELEAMRTADGVWQFRNRPRESGGDESTVGRLPRRKGSW
jgi:hypothetical protein